VGGTGRRSVSGVRHRSVEHSVRAWVRANGCREEPATEVLPDRVGDGTAVTAKSYRGGKGGAEVVLVAVGGGGHTWPGRVLGTRTLGRATRNVSANDLMWEFFRRHPMS
jgi:polyhydroxybutyrate depolymerase